MASLTAKDVLGSLCGTGTNCLWSPVRLVAAPNTTTLVGWEADLLLLHPSGWVWEVEKSDSAFRIRLLELAHARLWAFLSRDDIQEGNHDQ